MMLQLVARLPDGQAIAAKAAELLLCDRVRGERDRQRVPLRTRLGNAQPKLSQVVAIMEANTEEPLGLEELATLNEVTVRQLERLFHKYLQRTPASTTRSYVCHGRGRCCCAATPRCGKSPWPVALPRLRIFQELQPVLWPVTARRAATASLLTGC